MMPHQRFSRNWKKSLLILSSVFVGSCSFLSSADPTPEPKVVVETKFVEKNVPIQPRPKSLKLNGVNWYVVTPDNLGSLIPRFEKQLGEKWVFYVVEVPDYENLALNMADIKRYLVQQQKIIEYYEEALQKNDNQQSE
jgi:hypothetical protein